MATAFTYSFLDVNASIVGPGGSVNLGNNAGVSEEGITIEANDDINTMVIGADGTPMHSLSANKSGTVTVRLLKTSSTNQALQLLYDLQTSAAALHGQNTITLATGAGDLITCTQVAFKRAVPLTYSKDAGVNEWAFDAGVIFRVLSAGAPL